MAVKVAGQYEKDAKLDKVPLITDWIVALSSVASALAVVLGVMFAAAQVNSWRTESKEKRRRELAEELWATSHKIVDVFAAVRTPFSWVPKEEAGNRNYVYERRYKILHEKGGLFESLRDHQIRAKSVLADIAIDGPVDKIFEARSELFLSLEEIIEFLDPGFTHGTETRKLLVEARRKIWGNSGMKDDFGKALEDNLKVLEILLGPVIRLSPGGKA